MSMIGKSLAHYSVNAEIGKGGMGEVYQAKDQKLGRDVAIKVLPEEFARDVNRLARFQREAKLLASLNHPNIAAIHGLEEAEGVHFLVMELIEGQTLAERIKSDAIPVEEALKLALQIAEALEAAHEKGVIHRDLKPANIKVTPDGKVKVLDFGLAKAYAGDSESMNLSNSPTLSDMATQQGVILGTAAYMSPEQARGKPVDKRTDVWAFGCVLYEILTGRSLFSGEDVSSTLARVLEREPDFSALPPNLHPRIRLLLERCLKKEPKNRYSGISDARVDIHEVLANPSGVFAQPIPIAGSRKHPRLSLHWVVAMAILCIVVGGTAVLYLKPPGTRQVVCLDHDLDEGQQFSIGGFSALAVSPDGLQVAYSTNNGIYLRSLDTFTAKLIVGTEGETLQPFFSPNSQWIGYLSPNDSKLKKISIKGGLPVPLCDYSSFMGASWEKDNSIVFSTIERGIVRVSENSGTPQSILKPEARLAVLPQILPDGESILYTTFATFNIEPGQSRIMLQSLKSGKAKELFPGIGARYLPTGHIIYVLNRQLFAVPFDVGRQETTGEHVPLVDSIYNTPNILPQYAVSDAGTLAYIPQPATGSKIEVDAFSTSNLKPVWVDHAGNEEQIAGAPSNIGGTFRISPDGEKVAYEASIDGIVDIWTWDFNRDPDRRTFEEASEGFPLWTPDSKYIVYHAGDLANGFSINMKAADGRGGIETLGTFPFIPAPYSWSKDGKYLILQEVDFLTGRADITMLSVESDHERKPLLEKEYVETQGRISPDGKWITYVSNEFGKHQIFVRPFPEVDQGQWQISTDGGTGPLWSPDSRRIYYRNEDAVMARGIESNPPLTKGNPEILFRANYYYYRIGGVSQPSWDIHPDGKRFLMIKESKVSDDVSSTEESAATGPRKFNVVTNWFEELKEKVPVD